MNNDKKKDPCQSFRDWLKTAEKARQNNPSDIHSHTEALAAKLELESCIKKNSGKK